MSRANFEMETTSSRLKRLRWTARISALLILVFSLPFYFGYGNPLPFRNQDYSLIENIWLIILPITFFGLGLGWIYERVGGYLITIPIFFGLLLGLIFEKEFLFFMIIPFTVGIMYLLVGYNKVKG